MDILRFKYWSLLPCRIFLPAMCLATLFSSCNNTPKPETTQTDNLALSNVQKTDSVASIEYTDSLGEYTMYYIVVADSGKDYYALDHKMYELNKILNWPVDTMNRHFDASKKRIVLAEDDEDEMYRGAYFPRRDASTTLSLEYYDVYSPASTPDNIVLIAGIFDQKTSADSMQRILQSNAPKSFVMRAKVFSGCMH